MQTLLHCLSPVTPQGAAAPHCLEYDSLLLTDEESSVTPLYKSAFALAREIRSGQRSAEETLEFFLHRIRTHNPSLNVVVALDEDGARERAQAADVAAQRGEDWGPLHGVPVTIKDAFCTSGLITVGGIPDCANHIPRSNAIAVQRYVDAGAIVFGKTNVPFMSADLQSFNEVYGISNNPWNTARTCGGSSGGAAAAVAAGLTPLEIGSDIGGSIRTPSHFNGVYGHKSSYGLVSQRGHLPPGEHTLSESDLSVVGPIGHCVDDIEQALELMKGAAPEDSRAWDAQLSEASFTASEQLRVAIWADDEFCPVDHDIRAAIEAAGNTLADLGAHVDFAARPDFDPEHNHHNYTQLLSAAVGAGMPQAVRDAAAAAVTAADADDMSEPLLQMRGVALRHADWLRQHERRLRTRRAWDQFFEAYDVVICPCAHVTAFAHDHTPDMHNRRLTVNGEERRYTDILRWSGLTLNAYLPATAVPVGLSSEGLPIGAQIAAPYLGDKTCLAVARLLETHHRAFLPPPGYAE